MLITHKFRNAVLVIVKFGYTATMTFQTFEKEIREFSAEEFVSFKTFFTVLEQEMKERYLEELREQIPKLSPIEVLKLPITERNEILRMGSLVASLSGMYDPNSEMMEWIDVGIDDGIDDE